MRRKPVRLAAEPAPVCDRFAVSSRCSEGLSDMVSTWWRAGGAISRILFPKDPGGDHSSRTTVTRRLKRPTRKRRTGRPLALPYLVLLRMGFTWLPMLPREPVSSYLTLSPLPSAGRRRSALCGTFLRVTPTGRYPASCPAEFGLSSDALSAGDRLAPPVSGPYIPPKKKKQVVTPSRKSLKYC